MSDEDRANSERFDLVQEYAQALLGILESSKLLEHIPVVKTITAAVKAVASVRDANLIGKIAAFLDPLRELAPEQREQMVHRLEAVPRYGRKVGQHVIEYLDRVDSHRKPTMAGLCFLAFAQNAVDQVQLQRLLTAIERLPSTEFDSPRTFINTKNNQPERDRIHPESLQALLNAGLTIWTASAPIGNPRAIYTETRTCTVFVELNLDVRSMPN
jgi:hypothetical protein